MRTFLLPNGTITILLGQRFNDNIILAEKTTLSYHCQKPENMDLLHFWGKKT